MTKVNANELAALLIKLEADESLNFYESYDEETGETEGAYGAAMINRFDSYVIFINYYGGGTPCVIDITNYYSDLCKITADINEYFRYNDTIREHVFVDDSPAETTDSFMFDRLMAHVGHDIEVVTYGGDYNVSIECLDCYEVLYSVDNPVCGDTQSSKNIPERTIPIISGQSAKEADTNDKSSGSVSSIGGQHSVKLR